MALTAADTEHNDEKGTVGDWGGCGQQPDSSFQVTALTVSAFALTS